MSFSPGHVASGAACGNPIAWSFWPASGPAPFQCRAPKGFSQSFNRGRLHSGQPAPPRVLGSDTEISRLSLSHTAIPIGPASTGFFRHCAFLRARPVRQRPRLCAGHSGKVRDQRDLASRPGSRRHQRSRPAPDRKSGLPAKNAALGKMNGSRHMFFTCLAPA